MRRKFFIAVGASENGICGCEVGNGAAQDAGTNIYLLITLKELFTRWRENCHRRLISFEGFARSFGRKMLLGDKNLNFVSFERVLMQKFNFYSKLLKFYSKNLNFQSKVKYSKLKLDFFSKIKLQSNNFNLFHFHVKFPNKLSSPNIFLNFYLPFYNLFSLQALKPATILAC